MTTHAKLPADSAGTALRFAAKLFPTAATKCYSVLPLRLSFPSRSMLRPLLTLTAMILSYHHSQRLSWCVGPKDSTRTSLRRSFCRTRA